MNTEDLINSTQDDASQAAEQAAFDAEMSKIGNREQEQELREEVQEMARGIGGLTDEQVKELLLKASRVDDIERDFHTTRDKIFGKFGELNRSIQQGGSGIDVSVEDFEELAEQYPELAPMIAAGLSKAIAKAKAGAGGGGSGPSVEQIGEFINGRVNEEVEKATRKMSIDALTDKHPDWESTVQSTDFKLWAQTLPTDKQEELATSWNPQVVSRYISDFSSRSQSPRKQQNSSNYLTSAIAPTRGTQSAPSGRRSEMSEEDAFKAERERLRKIKQR